MRIGDVVLSDAFIGILGVLAGSLVTLFGERRRRRWEDKRRLIEVKRASYTAFLYRSNDLFHDITALRSASLQVLDLSQALRRLDDAVRSGSHGQIEVEELRRLKGELARLKSSQARLGPHVEQGLSGLKQAEADLFLLGSDPLLARVRRHRDIVFTYHEVALAAERRGVPQKVARDKYAGEYYESLSGLRTQMREEITFE